MRLGIFGGTFDPPHVGHLIVARDALEALDLDRVLFVPAGLPPHKQGALTPAALRLDMVRAAIAGEARFDVDALELRRDGPSYTVDTLRALRARHPDAELFLLLGTDQLRELETWREPGELGRLARIVALERGGAEAGAAPCDHRLAVTRIDVSATAIRARVTAGRSIRWLVPEAVAAMIAREGLYREPERGAAGTASPARG